MKYYEDVLSKQLLDRIQFDIRKEYLSISGHQIYHGNKS